MYDTARDFIDALQANPAVLAGLLDGCTQAQAQAARGGDEGWSVVEVVCHLRDAEERTLERTRAIRDEPDPALAAYDQDVWARERHYAAADLREAFATFVSLRARYVAELQALPRESWERTGRHAEQGTITIADLARHIVTHDAIHAAQLARQLGRAPA